MTTRQDIIDEAQRLVDTLEARGKTHGSGDLNFIVSADLLNAFGFRKVRPAQVDGGLHQIDKHDVTVIYRLLKLARIATGDRMEPDHSLDEAGYSIIDAAMVRANVTGTIGDHLPAGFIPAKEHPAFREFRNPLIHPQMPPDDRQLPRDASHPQAKP